MIDKIAKKPLIVIALDLQKGGNGFSTRVRMECNYLKSDYNIIILTDSTAKIEDWMKQFEVVVYPTTKMNIPKIRVLFNKRLLNRALAKLLKKYPNAIIYGESLKPLIYASKMIMKKNNKVVYDCHGAEPAEKEFNNPGIIGKISAYYMYKQEQTILKYCSLVVTVTDKQYAILNTSVPHIKFPMIPSKIFFEEHVHKKLIRDTLQIPQNAVVFVYSGGADKWQMCEETVRFYQTIEESNENAFFLILSNAQKEFEILATKYQLRKYLITSVNYSDMPKYLDACDYGFCLRQNIVVNNVASPTKIYEYLARNVKPIITDCIGDFSDELKKENLACVITYQDVIKRKISSVQLNSREINFNGDKYVEEISNMYIEKYKEALSTF